MNVLPAIHQMQVEISERTRNFPVDGDESVSYTHLEAAIVHGIEPEVLVARVNAFVESKQA